MHQHAIDLIRFHRPILQHQNRVARIQLPRRTQGGLHDRHGTAEHASLRVAANQRLTAQRNHPAAIRLSDCVQQRCFVVAAGRTRASVETRRHHRPIKRHPTASLPQKNLQRTEVTEANNDFRLARICAQRFFHKIVRTVPTAQRHEAIYPLVSEIAEQLQVSFGYRGREIPV